MSVSAAALTRGAASIIDEALVQKYVTISFNFLHLLEMNDKKTTTVVIDQCNQVMQNAPMVMQ